MNKLRFSKKVTEKQIDYLRHLSRKRGYIVSDFSRVDRDDASLLIDRFKNSSSDSIRRYDYYFKRDYINSGILIDIKSVMLEEIRFWAEIENRDMPDFSEISIDELLNYSRSIGIYHICKKFLD